MHCAYRCGEVGLSVIGRGARVRVRLCVRSVDIALFALVPSSRFQTPVGRRSQAAA